MSEIPKKRRLTNPNKVNQYTGPDPRQALFLSSYIDPRSPTFGNAFQSALAAKYSEDYALAIKSQMPDWLSENLAKLGDQKRVFMAEQHLDEVLNLPILIPAMGAFGPLTKKIPTGKFKMVRGKRKKIFKEEPIMVYSTSLIKEKTKATEITLEGLAKERYGKTKPGGGNALVFNFNQMRNQDKQKYS